MASKFIDYASKQICCRFYDKQGNCHLFEYNPTTINPTVWIKVAKEWGPRLSFLTKKEAFSYYLCEIQKYINDNKIVIGSFQYYKKSMKLWVILDDDISVLGLKYYQDL